MMIEGTAGRQSSVIKSSAVMLQGHYHKIQFPFPWHVYIYAPWAVVSVDPLLYAQQR